MTVIVRRKKETNWTRHGCEMVAGQVGWLCVTVGNQMSHPFPSVTAAGTTHTLTHPPHPTSLPLLSLLYIINPRTSLSIISPGHLHMASVSHYPPTAKAP